MMFDRKLLKSWAGSASFERGERYFAEGRVGDMHAGTDSIRAIVCGTDEYHVQLDWREDDLDYECDCPVGNRYEFCKHCVAVGLAWLVQISDGNPAESGDARIRGWLEGREKTDLINMIMEIADRDSASYKRLALKAASSSHDLKALKQSILESVSTSGFVDYYGARRYGRKVAAVTEMLEEMLRSGHAEETQELALYAIDRMDTALLNIDDSDGIAGGELGCWQEIHFNACQAVTPASAKGRKELARQLFKREMGTNWDTFYGAAETYADVLGKEGLAEYRHLVKKEWENLPTLAPGDKEDYQSKRYKVTAMMEALAKASGDVDELILIKSRDLSCAYRFLQIAEIYRAAKRHDKALAWAEKGVTAFAGNPDTRLEEFLAAEDARRKQFNKAVALVWGMFERTPSLEAWKRLKKYADKAGTWDKEWRDWALDHVRDQIAEQKKKAGTSRWFLPDHSLLVEIFLFEKDVESAWHEASHGGCHAELWRALGSALGSVNPVRAASCWQRLVDPSIDRKNNHAYDEAVRLLESIGGWLKNAGKEAVFTSLIADIRLRHKAKRNLMQRMDQHHLGERI